LMMRNKPFLLLAFFIIAAIASGCALPRKSEPPKPVEELSRLERLGHEESQVRRAEYEIIMEEGRDAVPDLIEGLRSDDAGIRNFCATILGQLGPDAVDAVPALVETFHDEYSEVAATAVEAVGKIGPDASDAIPALIEKLHVKNWELNEEVSHALGLIGPAAVPELIPLLESDVPRVIYWSAETLDQIGPSPSDVVGAAVAAPKERSRSYPPCWVECGKLLVAIGPDVDIRPILEITENEDGALETRVKALYVVEIFTTGPETHLPVLVDLFKEDSRDIRAEAIKTIGSIGRNPEACVPALMPFLDDEYYGIRANAALYIGNFGPSTEQALPKLRDLAENDPDSSVRERAVEAIAKIEGAALVEENESDES
jgi:HEAT repeat protein